MKVVEVGARDGLQNEKVVIIFLSGHLCNLYGLGYIFLLYFNGLIIYLHYLLFI